MNGSVNDRRQTAITRLASLVLAVALLVISAWGIASSNRVDADIGAAGRSADAADRFQDLRYLVIRETADAHAYVLAPSVLSSQDYHQTSAAVSAALSSLGTSTPPARTRDVAILAQLVTAHSRYDASAAAMLELIDQGQPAAALQLHNAELDPLAEQMDVAVAVLEWDADQAAKDNRTQAASTAAFLHAATPLVVYLGLGLVLVFALVSRRHRRTIEQHALHDALTGLPNRRLFADRARQALSSARRTKAEPVVLVLDLDGFKEVNDTLGHHMGDQLLVEAAGRLAGMLRPGDTVARLGGDEFAILLTQGGLDTGQAVAQRILDALEEPFVLDGLTIGIEASIGIASQDDPTASSSDQTGLAQSVVDLLRHADSAMFTAKAERLGFAVHQSGTDDPVPSRLAALGELRRALDHDELLVYLQPKIATDLGEVVGVEALARWLHPTRGLLPPSEFIGLAESTTLIHRLTTIVLGKALAVTRDWLDAGVSLPVSVNISARCLLDPAFPAVVSQQLLRAGVPPQLLCLELTESVIMVDPERAQAALQELRELNVRLAVDDFGTGYSSMAYLRVLPVHELKVDRTFVSDMTTNERNTVLVQSAIDLGHNLGLSVVAEGVEDHDTLAALRRAGADVVQGYYTGRPMPADELRSWVLEHKAVVQGSGERV